MKIGNVEIKGHVILGPMAGITSLAYREFNKPFGVGLSVTEMVSDCGLCYENKRTFEYLETSQNDSPVAIQLFGFDAKNTVKAIGIIEKCAKYDILDINLGCPVTKVVKTGAGSAWLKEPAKLGEYMKEIVKASNKPVTAKIRLGWDEESINVFEVAHVLEDAGVAAIAIHCRTRSQGYAGKANYEAIKGLKEELRIPLIVSGDIFSAMDAKRAIEITHADFVMVARGAEGHPFLITQINKYLDEGVLLPDPSPKEQAVYLEDFAKRLIALKGEEIAIKELRGIAPKFFGGMSELKRIRMDIATNIHRAEDLFKITNRIKSNP